MGERVTTLLTAVWSYEPEKGTIETLLWAFNLQNSLKH